MPSLTPSPEPIGWSEREADSQMLSLADTAVLLLTHPSPGVVELMSALNARNFVPLLAADVAAASAIGFRPRFAIVDTSVPRALEQLLARPAGDRPQFTLAWISGDERDGDALAAGATVTLRRPWLVKDVLFVLERMRCDSERWSAAREALDRDRTAVSVPVVEAVMTALQHELRNPLAAALSNLECLREELPPELAEQRALSAEIQGSLRRMTGVLDAVSTLIDGRKLERERVCLLEAAERTARELHSRVRIRVLGDRGVFARANRELLHGILTTLIEDAIACSPDAPVRCTIRVYGTGTEARISLRDSVADSDPDRSPRTLDPVIRLGGDPATGLSLPAVRHAVSRMQGTIDLVRDSRGRVFRIRLRRG